MDNIQKLSVPLAIVIAGALIAGAVYFASIGRGANYESNDGVYAESEPRSPTDAGQLSDIAKSLNLDVKAFESCMKEGTYAERVAKDAAEVQAAGGEGTPHSIVLVGNQQIPIKGAQPFESLKIEIDKALQGVKSTETVQENIRGLQPDDHILGNPDAEIIIVEYSDAECPFCKSFHLTLHQVVDQYQGKVAWVYRHWPIPQLHPKAPKEAEAFECAGALGGNDMFWKYADKVLETTRSNNTLNIGVYNAN